MPTAIRPPNAPAIWLADNTIFLELPSPDGGASHTLHFQAGVLGLHQIVTLLRERTRASRLGERGDPIQHMIDYSYNEAKVQRAKPSYPQALRDATRKVLQELGIVT